MCAPRCTAAVRRRLVGVGLAVPLLALAAGCREDHEVLAPQSVPAQDTPEAAAATPGESSELAKIRELSRRVQTSGFVFVRGGRKQTAAEAAAYLDSELARTKVDTARAFIEHIAKAAAVGGKPFVLHLSDGTNVSIHEWLTKQLDEIEGGQARVDASAARPELAAQGPATARAPTINDAFAIIEGSGLHFVVPQRKGKIRVYDAIEFSQLLRQKWEWIGKDIEDLDTFLEEIATESFSTFRRYRVRLADGREEDLRPWLEARLRQAPDADSAAGAVPR